MNQIWWAALRSASAGAAVAAAVAATDGPAAPLWFGLYLLGTGLALWPLGRQRDGTFDLHAFTPAALTAVVLAWAQPSRLEAFLVALPLALQLGVGAAGNAAAAQQRQAPKWAPEDLISGALLAAWAGILMTGLLARPLLLWLAVVLAVALTRDRHRLRTDLLASLAALLPSASYRAARWLVGTRHELLAAATRATGGAGLALPPTLTPRRTLARWRLRCALDHAWVATNLGAMAPWFGETAYQQASSAVRRFGTAGIALEAHAQLAELAFRAGRYEAVVQHVERLGEAAQFSGTTKATERLLTHAALLGAMAQARLGRTADALAALSAVDAQRPSEADLRLLRSLAEATVRMAYGDHRDLVHRLRRSLTWADHEQDQVTGWWRLFAQVLAAEAALEAGDDRTAETYLVGPGLTPAPTCPQAALVLARARSRRGDREGAADALGQLLIQVPSGPLAEAASAQLRTMRESDGP